MLNGIIKKTPKNLLKEIILYDDQSVIEISNAIKTYMNLVKKWPNKKIKFYKSTKREGLIRARVSLILYFREGLIGS